MFRHLTDAELGLVWPHIRVRSSVTDEVLEPASTFGSAVGFAWSGSYRITIRSPAHAHITMRTVNAGGHFGDVSIFAGNGSDYHVVVDDTGVLLFVAGGAFADLVLRIENLCRAVLRGLAQAASVRGDRLYEFATMNVRLRLLAELLRLSHGAERVGERLVIKDAPTHHAIATQVGTTREGVTKQMQSLAREGLLESSRRQIEILQPQKLREIVEEAGGPRASYAPDES